MSKIIAVIFFFLLSGILPSKAHEVRPMIVDFSVEKEQKFSISMKLNLEAYLADIGIEHADTADDPNAAKYDQLRNVKPDDLSKLLRDDADSFLSNIAVRFDGGAADISLGSIKVPEIGDVDLARDSIVTIGGSIPEGAQELVWQMNDKMGASVFRFVDITKTDTKLEAISTFVNSGEESRQVTLSSPQAVGAFATFLEYIYVGFDHIIPKGLDHILFVVGLFLLSTRLVPLLWQVTSFTVAHTVTLALGMMGIVNIPGNIVEPLIAASIVYVAVENLFMSSLSPWRPVLVFGFGLLHGLGFAGVLREFGLSSGNFISGLIGFNVGVELGQLAVIAICFLLVGFWFGKKDWYRRTITIPGSLLIAAVGAYWFYERVFLV